MATEFNSSLPPKTLFVRTRAAPPPPLTHGGTPLQTRTQETPRPHFIHPHPNPPAPAEALPTPPSVSNTPRLVQTGHDHFAGPRAIHSSALPDCSQGANALGPPTSRSPRRCPTHLTSVSNTLTLVQTGQATAEAHREAPPRAPPRPACPPRPARQRPALSPRPAAPSRPRTKWTRRVPHPVVIGHAASLTP